MHRVVLSTVRFRAGAKVIQRPPGLYSTNPTTIRRLSQQTEGPKQPGTGNGTGSNQRNAEDLPPELDNIGIPPTNFSKPTLTALNFWYRFAKFSFIGLAVLAGGAFAALEGTHLWVEHVGLARPEDSDGELERCGWVKEMERWTGGEKGGTDPALGTKAKYALRSAWITRHWGTGAQVISANTLAQTQQSSEKAVEARLEYCHDFLALALGLALESERIGKQLRPETISEILVRKAATLERIGSKGALYDARATYEHVWDNVERLGADMDERARLALKLGDVNARLGDADEACSWWARSLRLAGSPYSPDSQSTKLDVDLQLPTRLPDSPHAQRTLAATLSSLSAFYAQFGRLSDARRVEDAGIALLASSVPSITANSDSISNDNGASSSTNTPKSPPQTLHDLYLQHRLSLLALHRAEVSHALRSSSSSSPPSGTLEELAKAAVEAENVIFSLSSPPSSSSPSASPSLPSPTSISLRGSPLNSLAEAPAPAPAHKTDLDASYDKNRALKGPAGSLLKDARRTAVHSWTLSGILHENAASSLVASSSGSSTSSWRKILPGASTQGGSEREKETEKSDAERKAALRCYARALAWAGGASSPSSGTGEGEPEPGKDLLESEWRALWEGYSRVRDAVLASASASTGDEKTGTKRD